MLEEALREQGVEVFQADEGFFTYSRKKEQGKKVVQVVSAYLKPEHRNPVVGRKVLESLESHLKMQEENLLVWPVDMKDLNKENQLLLCLHLGFKLQNADPSRLVLSKQV
jgi:hypothetical protein